MDIVKETDKNDHVNNVNTTESTDTGASEAGSAPATQVNVGIRNTVENAEKDGVITDKAYWMAVLNGEKRPNPEWLKLLLDRYHVKLLKK